MITKQQKQAFEYFKKHARNWRMEAESVGTSKVNIIEQRNGYVQQIANERSETRSFLDVGCGTGELVCNIAKKGIDAIGVDFAIEMIELASKKAKDLNIARTKFSCCSIFDFEIQPESYDLISANGFIEYISQQEMLTFFDLAVEALAPGGSFIVGSRNRLFNIISMNDFTLQEHENESIDLLIREAVKWTNADTIVDIVKDECVPVQKAETEHAITGIDVSTRYQYTPFQLISLLQDKGLQAVEVYPVHIHGVSPAFKKDNAEIHTSIANLLQEHARHNTKLLTQATTFMVHAKKAE